MAKITQFSRRSFIQSAGAFLALPHLESFAQTAKPEKIQRMIFLAQGYGFVNKSFYPTQAGKFSEIGLTEGMAPLKKHQNDISLLGNLTNVGATNPHQGTLTFLTGASYINPRGFKNTISCDQVAAKVLSKSTRYNSLTLSTKERKSGHGSAVRSMAWNHQGKPISGLETSLELYKELFSGNESKEAIFKRIQEQRSVLDAMKINARSLSKNISKTDKEKLDEYFDSIRQIETNLQKQIEWSNVAKPKANFKHPKELDGEAEVKLMYDMICLALQTDQTRVVTYMMPSQSVLKSMGLNVPVHSLSHYNISPEREGWAKQRDHKCMELFSYFLDKLKTTKDQYGLSLYDTSTIAYGSNIRSVHTIKNFPVFLSGGGIKMLRRGESIMLKKETPLQNIWLTLLQENGVEVSRFSSSTGNAPEILT